MSARAELEVWLSRRHPADVKRKLDAHRDEVLAEAAARQRALDKGLEDGYERSQNYRDGYLDGLEAAADLIDPEET